MSDVETSVESLYEHRLVKPLTSCGAQRDLNKLHLHIATMDHNDELEWSDKDISLRAFYQKYKRRLPAILLTTSGYNDTDNVNDISTDETYYVFQVSKQKRVIAKRQDGRYVSIPLNYQLLFQRLPVGRTVPTKLAQLTLSDVVRQGVEKFQLTTDDAAQFDFGAGSSTVSYSQLGPLKFVDKYNEKYLLAYPVVPGEICPTVIGIPVYLPITVKVANGLISSSKKDKDFRKFLDRTAAMTNNFPKEHVPCTEILVFDHLPNDGDYEYVDPSKYARQGGSDECFPIPPLPAPDNDDEDEEYDDASFLRRQSTSVCQDDPDSPLPPPPTPPAPAPPPPPPRCNRGLSGHATPMSLPIRMNVSPRTATTPPEPLPCDDDDDDDKDDYEQPIESFLYPTVQPRQPLITVSPTADDCPPLTPPPAPPVSPLYRQRTPVLPVQSGTKIVFPGRQSQAAGVAATKQTVWPVMRVSPLTSSQSPVASVTTGNGNADDRSSKRTTIGDEIRWKHIRDVPSDVENFSVEQVVYCLELLGMSGQAAKFADQKVDGRLLVDAVTEDVLVSEFGCQRFTAKRMFMFVKGWRPKEEAARLK